MSAELIIRPGETLRSWDEFITKNPKGYVIALDGYLNEPPGFKRVGYKSPAEPGGPYSNLDHHTGVDRLATLSSAQQALRAVRLGLVDAYTNDGEYQAKVFVNDPDQDVILAWHILRKAEKIASHKHKKDGDLLRNFVDMAGDLDVTAGAYPQPLRLLRMRQIAWVFRPYTEARARGELTGMPAITGRLLKSVVVVSLCIWTAKGRRPSSTPGTRI